MSLIQDITAVSVNKVSLNSSANNPTIGKQLPIL